MGVSTQQSGGLTEHEQQRLATMPHKRASAIPRGTIWRYRCPNGHAALSRIRGRGDTRTRYYCHTCARHGHEMVHYHLVDTGGDCPLPRQGYEQIDTPIDREHNPLAGAFERPEVNWR